jgi:hypothetical protein
MGRWRGFGRLVGHVVGEADSLPLAQGHLDRRKLRVGQPGSLAAFPSLAPLDLQRGLDGLQLVEDRLEMQGEDRRAVD